MTPIKTVLCLSTAEFEIEIFLDGLTYTIVIGESLFLPKMFGPDHDGIPQIVDHWCVGSPGMGRSEMSEALGTTGIPMNMWKLNSATFIENIELGFSSRHAGLIQAVFADGHIQIISDSISLPAWHAIGTRAESDNVQF